MEFIDIHVHPVLIREALELDGSLREAARSIFRIGTSPQPLETLILEMDNAGVERAILLALDAKTVRGFTLPSNDVVYKLLEKAPERFWAFASVDPHDTGRAVAELERAVCDLGFLGLKLSPPIQMFKPSDENLEPLYEKAVELEVPVLFHSGFTWLDDVSIYLAHPREFEVLALKYPELKIVLAHAGWPWVDEAMSLAMKYRNVYLDVSNVYTGTPVEHLRTLLTEEHRFRLVERFISEKIVFGSDYPRIEIDKMVEALLSLNLSYETKKKILRENAQKLIGSRKI